ncbi:MAG TPA: ribonuclease HII [Bacteroidota bacterium]|nr:ribonuclease HII [Bacteroidota bacterium]
MTEDTVVLPFLDLEVERYYWSRGLRSVAGVDEAGRGPLAGPVVAAAVVFHPETSIPGVDDSKKLTEEKREALFTEISQKALAVGVGIVDHETIDRINILQASFLAMRKAIDSLPRPPEVILADGRGFQYEFLVCENIIDGDAKVFSIAAASIIAKVTRDRLMVQYDEQFPQYGFAKHKGYATKEHLEAIRSRGICPIHRRSFRLHDGWPGEK